MASSSGQVDAQTAATTGTGWSATADAFRRADTQLVGINGQQTDLQAAVVAGELWMDEGVAQKAASRCDQAIREINESLRSAQRLSWTRKFGANEDGWAAASRFARAGREYIAMMENARTVIENMAATYRAAGLTAEEADAAGKQLFRNELK